MAFETTTTVNYYWWVIKNKRAPTGLSRTSQRYSLQYLTLHNNLWLNAIFIIHTESCLPYFMRPSCRGEAEIWEVKVDECGQQNVRVGGDTWYPHFARSADNDRRRGAGNKTPQRGVQHTTERSGWAADLTCYSCLNSAESVVTE